MEIDLRTPIPKLSRRPGVTAEQLMVRCMHDLLQKMHEMETDEISRRHARKNTPQKTGRAKSQGQ